MISSFKYLQSDYVISLNKFPLNDPLMKVPNRNGRKTGKLFF